MDAAPTIHASVVLAGAHGVLIRGPGGAGKSRLVLNIIDAAAAGRLAFARLVADDRVHLQAVHHRLIARPPAVLAGLLEVRGLGIRQLPYEPLAVVSWVVDLAVAAAPRLPDADDQRTVVAGVGLRRLAVARGCDPLPLVLAAIAGRSVFATPVAAATGGLPVSDRTGHQDVSGHSGSGACRPHVAS